MIIFQENIMSFRLYHFLKKDLIIYFERERVHAGCGEGEGERESE